MSQLSGLSKFPEFEPINLQHQELVASFNRNLESNFSDFSFASLFSLDDNNSLELTNLRGNLAVQLVDSVSQTPLVSLLGVTEIDRSIRDLIAYLKENLRINYLSFVPQLTVNAISDLEQLRILPERDNEDYLYSIPEVVAMQGGKFANFRRKVNLCSREVFSGEDPTLLVGVDPAQVASFIQLYFREVLSRAAAWPGERLGRQRDRLGLEKLLLFWGKLKLDLCAIKVEDEVKALAIVERIPRQTLLIHHYLVDHRIDGWGEFFFWKIARHFQGVCSLINFEQDLGIPGLRKFKQHLQPCRRLSKFHLEIQ